MRGLFLVVLLLVCGQSWAVNFAVINTNDSGIGSLRQAIINANGSGPGPHSINFAVPFPEFGSIALQSNLPVIDVSPVSFSGGGRTPIIDGGGSWSILRADRNVSLTVTGINFQFGVAEDGGCIATDVVAGSGTLDVENSFFTGCVAEGAFNSGGGAISWSALNGGFLRIEDSGFFDNQVNTPSIAMEQPRGGAVDALAAVSIINTIFRDNSVNSASDAGGYGGAVNIFSPDGAFHEIVGSTFDANSTDEAVTSLGWGGAVRVFLRASALLQVQNSFFTDNSARFGGALYVTSASGTDDQMVLANSSFNENSATVTGGSLFFRSLEVFATHNTFYRSDAPSGSHLEFDEIEVTNLVHNVLAESGTGAACDLTDIETAGGDLAGNLFAEACGALSASGGMISANLAVLDVDTQPPVGVIIFEPGADPIDGGTNDPADCASEDARGNPRPQDGDDDGNAVCDVGAYENPLIPLVKDGFENLPTRAAQHSQKSGR